jgi:putative transposase
VEAVGCLPTTTICEALSVSRATLYRRLPGESEEEAPPCPEAEARSRTRPARALTEAEEDEVMATLRSERFMDMAPAAIYAKLLEEGVYLCSERTMYRLLSKAGESRERRDQRTHPEYTKPELLATAPNQVWSWDITKLRGPEKWTYFYLYVVLDVFSRYVVGWLLADGESAALASRLLTETCDKQDIEPDQLTVHADRGTAMKSKLLAQKLADLGVTRSFSRPQVSDDNPFSESQFKTMKYRPEFPDRFPTKDAALEFCRQFFAWYNEEHQHSGIALFTPSQVHHGEAPAILEKRRAALQAAWEAHPERFVHGAPRPATVPAAVWINPPAATTAPDATP